MQPGDGAPLRAPTAIFVMGPPSTQADRGPATFVGSLAIVWLGVSLAGSLPPSYRASIGDFTGLQHPPAGAVVRSRYAQASVDGGVIDGDEWISGRAVSPARTWNTV